MDGYLSKPIDTEALWHELEGVSKQTLQGKGKIVSDKPKLVVADFVQAMELMDNNRELFDEIVSLFTQDAPMHMQHIKDGLAQGNPDTVRHSAHTIKGMVGIFSAERTAHAAAVVEKAAGQQNCSENVDELDNALNELMAAIAAYCEN